MASTTLGDVTRLKRDRKWVYCDHCGREVSNSTFYRHKRHRFDSDSSDGCDDAPGFAWSDDEETEGNNNCISSFVEESAALRTDVSCMHVNVVGLVT